MTLFFLWDVHHQGWEFIKEKKKTRKKENKNSYKKTRTKTRKKELVQESVHANKNSCKKTRTKTRTRTRKRPRKKELVQENTHSYTKRVNSLIWRNINQFYFQQQLIICRSDQLEQLWSNLLCFILYFGPFALGVIENLKRGRFELYGKKYNF